ncbi:DUF6232 family protein [Streptomyces sp. BBFR102]|uniref:DUF6232 family protein n=1 Tax=Streptomyces sp. BBFR102 TaxID=3448171 RepID=UPI003F531CA5
MTPGEQGPPEPAVPRQPSAPPGTGTAHHPAPAAPVAPPPPPAPPWHPGAVDLQVGKRLLWVGGAVYPLHNIARVYTFVLHPRRKEAWERFFGRIALIAVAVAVLTLLNLLMVGLASLGGGGEGFFLVIVLAWLAGIGAGIYHVTQLASVLSAKPRFVLAIETSGASTALVTSASADHLRDLVGRISYAIDHPETEFQVTVEMVNASPNHFYFGDNVNMYGGRGNVGMEKTG